MPGFEDFPIFKLSRSGEISGDTDFELSADLWNVPDPPDQLFIQGRRESLSLLNSLPDLGLAIVGTREPQARTLGLVEKSISLLSRSNSPLIIISGFARGTDAAAHEAALDCGLPTIGILGGGIDRIYPRENLALRDRILYEGGLMVSEFPLGSDALPHQFLLRNRLIAAWSRATWVVEASHRSGALNTAKWARSMDRLCFATPCFPGDASLAGNQKLIDDEFALPIWGTHSLGAAWLELSTLPETRKPRLKLIQSGLSYYSQALLEQVRHLCNAEGGVQIPHLLDWALESGWKSSDFFAALSETERSGLISRLDGIIFSGGKSKI